MSIAQWGIKGTSILVLCCIASPVAWGMGNSFHEAVQSGYTGLVERFLRKGTSVNKRDRYDKTALYYASRYGEFGITHLLLQWGAAVVGVGADAKETALHVAAEWNQTKVVKMLLQYEGKLILQIYHGHCKENCIHNYSIMIHL